MNHTHLLIFISPNKNTYNIYKSRYSLQSLTTVLKFINNNQKTGFAGFKGYQRIQEIPNEAPPKPAEQPSRKPAAKPSGKRGRKRKK